MRLVPPLAPLPGPDALADWEHRPVAPDVARGPRPHDHRDAFERVVGREPPGDPLPDGPLRRAAASILAYRVFPAWLLTPLLRRVPLEVGETVGAVYHPLGPRAGGILFASRVVRAFDEPTADGRAWRVGFTYQTLEGHPELGEETFSAEKDLTTGEVLVALRSWSRPGLAIGRALRPLVRLLQVRANDAALVALARAARGNDARVEAGPPRRRRRR